MKTTALACLILLASVSCGSLDPRLPAEPPPPNLLAGQVILEVPPEVVADLTQTSLLELRDKKLPWLNQKDPDKVRRIMAGQVTTGMTETQVLWIFLSHPTRIRDLGPPGGTVMMWEPGRYFVRFGAAGQATQAGRY